MADKCSKRPYYSLEEVKGLVRKGSVDIRGNVLNSADIDFGWGVEDVLDAILKLKPEHFYKTDPAAYDTKIMFDFYKAYGLKGENVYIHFYINDNTVMLVLNSFKRI